MRKIRWIRVVAAAAFTLFLLLGTRGNLLKVQAAALPHTGNDWSIDANGALTITGQAGMDDWTLTANRNTYAGVVTSASVTGNVVNVPNIAFQYCTNLESISLPAGVTSIGDGAFSDCSKLKSINLPEGLIAIGNSAFEGCRALSSIILPESLTYGGGYAFLHSGLTSVTFLGKTPPRISGNAFEGISSLNITVPLEAVDDYKTFFTDKIASPP